MKSPLQILIAEDNPADVRLMLRALRQAGFEFTHQTVCTEADYLACLHPDLDIILSDYEMPQFSGLRALELLRERDLDIPFVIVSGTIGEDLAVSVMKGGATDYLLKDRLARLGPAIDRAIEQGRMRNENRETQKALRESEERFRQLTENIQEVFWLTDVQKDQMLYVSPAYEQIWGRPRSELLASPRTWLNAIHPDDREGVFQSALSKQTQGIYDEEYRIVRPDGTIRWIRDRAFPVVGAAGEVDRVAGIASDITEAKESEEALRLFRQLVDQSDDTFEVIDPETARFLDVNDKGCAELGYTRAEHLALRVFDIDPLVTEADWPGVAQKIRAEGLKRNGLHRRKDGTTYPVELNAKWVRLGRDYIIVAVRDITERKRAEDILRESEQRYREQAAMLDRTQDAIIVRGFDDRKITFWSHGAETLYGWTVAEASGQDLRELIWFDSTVPDQPRAALLQEEEWRGETHHRTKGGKKLIVNTRATLIRDEVGNPKSVLSINTDVTEQKDLEARFLRAQRMESIGTLASGVAHDLNNILAPIMMSVPVLRKELTAEKRDEVVTTIEMSVMRGAQIVKQVLTFGRGLEGERYPLQVLSLIGEMMKIMRETFPKNIAIKNANGAHVWPVLGDATQIHQVLLNLCVNARDAMPEGGELRVGARNFDLDASYASMLSDASPGHHVLIEVSDTGSGMPPEVVERIFEPFYTTKGIGQGTGLGLSTVLGIVKGHGGCIQVNSQPGKGTVFQIYLPAAPDHENAAVDPVFAPIPEGRGELILVVDDEASIRDSVRLALETGGYRTLLATDGIDALGLFAPNAANIAMVLTDLMMPSMDGVTLIRALRAMAPAVPVIASTGLGEKAQLTQLTALGVATVLSKPFNADTLLRAIHDTLRPATPASSSDL